MAFTLLATTITQTGTDTINNALVAPVGMTSVDFGNQRTFSTGLNSIVQNGTIIIDETTAQVRNTTVQTWTINAGAILRIKGQKTLAANAPLPRGGGINWQSNDYTNSIILASTNSASLSTIEIEDGVLGMGTGYIFADNGRFGRIKTTGDRCWLLSTKGPSANGEKGRLRLSSTNPILDFQAGKTYVGLWLNIGAPQYSLKGYVPVDVDAPECTTGSLAVAPLIEWEDYDSTYVRGAVYPLSKMTLVSGALVRIKNNLLGTNMVWRYMQFGVTTFDAVLEFSKQITCRAQDATGAALSDGFMYYQPVGTNPVGVRPKGFTADRTYNLSQQNIPIVDGVATSEFVFASSNSRINASDNSTYRYYCSVTTPGAERHTIFHSRYGYDKQSLSVLLSGNGAATPIFTNASLPTSSKVIANAAAITGVSFNFTTKTMTISSNLNYQQIYDSYQYALNQTANLFIADDCLTVSATSNYVGWTIVLNTGVTLTSGGNFDIIQANTITINGTAKIDGVYKNSVGTSTIWEFGSTAEPITAGTSLAIYDGAGLTKYYNAVTTNGVYRYYIAPQAVGETFTYAIEKYGTRRESGTFPSNAGGILFYVPSYSEDVGITQLTQTVVNAYTTLSDTAQIYDATANFRLSEAGIKLGQLVARDGTFLDFGNFNVKIKDDASAIVSVASGTITYKSIVINESTKYNAMKATPPKTITPTDTELINVLIEDANGDSQINILGGASPFSIYKFNINTTDFPVGIIPDTRTDVGNFVESITERTYRFLFDADYNYFVFSPSIRSDANIPNVVDGQTDWEILTKGTYSAPLYKGNEIQLASDAPQLVENNQKLEEVILKLDTNLDVAVSTRLADEDYVEPATAQSVWEYTTRTLTSAGAAGATLAEIEGSLILAKEATSQDIKTKVDSLNNYDDATLISKVDTLQTSVDNIDVDFTPVLDAVATKPTLTEIEGSTVIANKTDVTTAKDEIIAELANIDVDNVAIANEVWNQEPERLKQVATVETTGDQLSSFNHS